jgi:hypothetical protein
MDTAMRFTSNVAGGVQRMLGGCTDVDPQQHGLTTEEERTVSRLIQVAGSTQKYSIFFLCAHFSFLSSHLCPTSSSKHHSTIVYA